MAFFTASLESNVLPYDRITPIQAVGSGTSQFSGVTAPSNGELTALVKAAQDSGSDGIWLRRGTYTITEPMRITKSGFRILGSSDAIIDINHSDSIGAVDVDAGLEFVEIRGPTFQNTTSVSGQSTLRFGANGGSHTVSSCKFFVHPALTYEAVSPASPMRCIDMQSVTGKIIENNTFLPYTGVIPIWLEAGNGANVQNNRVHNGIVTDLDQLTSLQTYYLARPCKVGIHMRNERHGWIHHNYFWAIGDVTNSVPMDAVIQYDYDRAAMGGTVSECGHMDISHNQMELCYAPKQMRLRGLQYSKIEGNNIGVSAGVMIADTAGEGGICLEAGVTGSDLCRWDTITGNNLHNNGKPNTDAAPVSMTSVDNIAVINNHCANLFCRYAVYIGDISTNVTVRSLVADFTSSVTNNYAIRVTGASTDKVTIGEVTGQGIDSAGGAGLVNNNAGGSQIIVNGLGKIGTGAYAAPGIADTADTLSTNIRVSTGV